MSVSYTILIKNKQPTNMIVSAIESILNCHLTRIFNREEYHSAVVLGVGISLVSLVPYDDDEIKYSDYDFEIMIEYKGAFDRIYSNDFRRMTSIVLANMVFRNLNCECLALEDLTVVLAKFAPSDS